MIRLLFIIILLTATSNYLKCEEIMKIGDWRSHFSYNNCFKIIETPTQFVGATNLGLITVNKEDNSIYTKTKVNGLSDFNISTINYLESNNSIIIGYINGNIDILKGAATININDLKIKNIEGIKRINSFLEIGNKVYCATDFGIMVINTDRYEIESTYYIGDNASNLKINELTTDNEYIYAATALGVKRARLDARDIQMYYSWETISSDKDNYASLLYFNGGIVAVKGIKGGTCTLLSIKDQTISTITSLAQFQNITSFNNSLVTTQSTAIRLYNPAFEQTSVIASPTIDGIATTANFRDVLHHNNSYYIADFLNGIYLRDEPAEWIRLLPDGPLSNNSRQVLVSNNVTFIAPGGLSQAWDNAGITASMSTLTTKGWANVTTQNSPLLQGARDILSVTVNPRNPDNIFISSWGSGVFELVREDDIFVVKNHFFKTENGLQNVFDNDSRYVRVSTTAFDKNNVLWMPNGLKQEAIVAYFPEDNTWMRYNYQSVASIMRKGSILVTSNNDKWMIVTQANPAKGLFIWNDNNTPRNQSDDRYRSAIPKSAETDNRNFGQIKLWGENGEVITDNIFTLAEDQNGHIWIGTDVGIVVHYQPQTMFTREEQLFSRIKVARDDGRGLADYLLEHEVVTAIAIDPANRKWLGTQGNGVFLVSADGTEQLLAFNSDNSPLPSNYVNSISINENTGEVFFATGSGIVSYKGTATKGSSNFKEFYAFPNPVRPGFNGNITITGLVSNTIVKVTDVSGKLVYETKSQGGQAFWDGKNLWGESVKSGVYLIFVSSEDGTDSGVTKVAIIR